MSKDTNLPKPASPPWLSRHLTGPAPVVVLLLVFLGLALSSSTRKCTTSDEIAHLTSGCSYWLHNDYRLNPENGNLPQRIAALPVLLGGCRFPSLNDPDWMDSNFWNLGWKFFYQEQNDPDVMLLRGRAAIAVCAVGLGIIVYFWSRSLFGPVGGLLSLTVFVFDTTFLAHGRLITSDLMTSLFFTASVGAFWMLLERVTPWRLLLSSVVMGGLFLSKMSGPLILPIVFLLCVVRLLRPLPLPLTIGVKKVLRTRGSQALVFLGLLVVHGLVVLLLIWTACGMRFSAFNPVLPGRDKLPYEWNELELEKLGFTGKTVDLAYRAHLLPQSYLYGFAHSYSHAFHPMWAGARRAFLNGKYSTNGFPEFFPYCFLVKTPLPTLGLLVLAVVTVVVKWRVARKSASVPLWTSFWNGFYGTAPLWILLAVYWTVSISAKLNIGQRHLLPTYPAVFILIGVNAWWFQRAVRRVMAVVVTGLLIMLMVASIWMWPDYLAYFNMIAGGPKNGYRHLVDSSLDWGQDLPGLRRWLERNNLTDQTTIPVYFSYFGNGSLEHYRIHTRYLSGLGLNLGSKTLHPLKGGVYCISATMLPSVIQAPAGPWTNEAEWTYQQLRSDIDNLIRRNPTGNPLDGLSAQEHAAWSKKISVYNQLRLGRLCKYLLKREPDDNVGYSILIYRLTDDQVREALFGPPVELVPAPLAP